MSDYFVHESSYVDDNVEIGSETYLALLATYSSELK